MAVPVTISGVEFDVENMKSCRIGPFPSSGGNYYGVFRQSADQSVLSIQKASDPTSSFSEVATVDLTNTIGNWSVKQVGDALHIAACTRGSRILYYGVFSMSSDTFTTALANTGAALVGTDAELKCAITVRSDGDVIVVYNGATDTI